MTASKEDPDMSHSLSLFACLIVSGVAFTACSED